MKNSLKLVICIAFFMAFIMNDVNSKSDLKKNPTSQEPQKKTPTESPFNSHIEDSWKVDVVKFNGTAVSGCIKESNGSGLSIDTLAGIYIVPSSKIESITKAIPGESALALGVQLLKQGSFDRARIYFQKAQDFPLWRKYAIEALSELEEQVKKNKGTQSNSEKQEIENLIHQKGLQAGISALKTKYQQQNEYWGSFRGKLHLMMARERLDHMDVKEAEMHLAMAEQYGVEPEKWKKVKDEITAVKRQNLLYGKSFDIANLFPKPTPTLSVLTAKQKLPTDKRPLNLIVTSTYTPSATDVPTPEVKDETISFNSQILLSETPFITKGQENTDSTTESNSLVVYETKMQDNTSRYSTKEPSTSFTENLLGWILGTMGEEIIIIPLPLFLIFVTPLRKKILSARYDESEESSRGSSGFSKENQQQRNKETQSEEINDDAKKPTGEYHSKDEGYYAKILRLGECYTPEEIKDHYRELANQYHPDKVFGLGQKLKDIAEQEMKQINEAYGFFKTKYDCK